MVEAVPELVWFALLLFAFGFVWAARKLLAAMFKSIIDAVNAAHIPYLGGYISDGLHAMEQACDNALGSAISGIDSLMGASWHAFARLNEWLWREFQAHTLIGWLLAQGISDLTHGYHYLRNLALGNHDAHTHDAARIKSLEREYRGIEAKIRTLERDYSHGIGHDVLPRLKTLEREATQIQDVQIPAIRAAEADAAGAISNLYDWARGKAALLGVGTFAAAVAAVIGADVLKLFKCPTFLSKTLGRGCGLWDGIEGMFGLFIDLFFITDMCDVLPLLEEAYSVVAAPAIGLLTEAIDAAPCVSGNQAPALNVPQLYLPANPGYTLSLP